MCRTSMACSCIRSSSATASARRLLERIDSDLRAQGFARARVAATLAAEGFFAERGWRRQGAVFGALDGGLIFVAMGMEKRFASDLRLAA